MYLFDELFLIILGEILSFDLTFVHRIAFIIHLLVLVFIFRLLLQICLGLRLLVGF